MGRTYKEKTLLAPTQLKKSINPEIFQFETTEQAPELTSIVGQDRGRAVMDFGLNIDHDGYNIYVSGIPGTGKTSFSYSIVNDFAKREVQLYDWCYVYNFADENYRPKVLRLPVGKGRELQHDMAYLMKELETEVPIAFTEEKYQKDRNNIIQKYKQETNSKMDELNHIAHKYGFQIKQTSSGMVTIPLKNGVPLDEKAYQLLSEEEQKQIEKNSYMIQEKIMEFSDSFRSLEKKFKKELEKLDQNVALTIVGNQIRELEAKYGMYPEIIQYLKDVKADIVKHIRDLLPKEEQEKANPYQAIVSQGRGQNFSKKYQVNVMVDNDETKGAPVITADNPTYYNLLGKVEYINQMGVMTTDFTKIKPGFIHQANGGYLIIQVKDILANQFAWDGLKRALTNSRVQIENIGESAGLVAASSIKPDPIPIQVKVILIGNRDMYQLLYQYDEDFRKLFKLKADFDTEMAANEENIKGLVSFIHSQCTTNNLRHFNREAVARIVEFSTRLTNNQSKLSTRFNQIVEIMFESNTWAKLNNANIITLDHVKKAIQEREYRHNLYEEKIGESIDEGDILIDTKGAVIGQVNGLAVYSSGQYNFGKPSRITVTTFVGEKGIINIERESKMSGSIHNKGVYILGGYLGEKFAQQHGLALTAHIAFEQSYGGVDGDSASSTELYAILSSLGDVPIDQGLAVTGSINQKGEIQPIGGVNEKIEGFYKVCKQRGLTGTQGVIIPHQNVKNLMLHDEVVEAVEQKQFHIYAVKSVEEGIGILTNTEVSSTDEFGNYTEDSLYGKVAQKLALYIKLSEQNNS